ncbi:ero1-like protein [Hyalella azteca]|uniref:Ero1-like protein n=1 Tax=Hyalella azteca TaxID=294128 RepID=A0A8B7P670_HYAAZ|nr:ero1-like protein [Hyalella azteca]
MLQALNNMKLNRIFNTSTLHILSTSVNKTMLLLLLISLAPAAAVFSKQSNPKPGNTEALERCLCQLKGLIDDCSCSVESIDSINNVQVYPILSSLLGRDFFRYWKVNLQKPCPFWPDDSRCAMRFCSVEQCEAPPGLRVDETEKPLKDEDCTGEEHLGYLNTTISEESRAGFEVWAAHDSARDDSFCEPEDDRSTGSAYVDLLANPERYTGYVGTSAHRVWSSIYQENCFSSGPTSGSSANSPFTHLTDTRDGSSGLQAGAKWGHNVEEFRRRFDPALTDGEGPTRLKNLYFLYIMELRALAKAGRQLELMQYFTGDPQEDEDVRAAISRLVAVARSFQYFDESTYFSNGQTSLKEEFRLHFRNITRIMDCVGCDKCKLWGKLQVTGLGTALKILFSGNFEDDIPQQGPGAEDAPHERPVASDVLKLTRNEVVALINSIGRLSRSIFELEQFRKMVGR